MKKTKATITETAATVAEQGAHVAPEKAPSKKVATPKKGAPKGQKATKAKTPATAPKKGAKAAKKAATKEAGAPRPETKGAKILELIGRPNGATLAEIMKATDWQRHSIRGFLSTAGRKRGIKIESAKNEAGERVYSITK